MRHSLLLVVVAWAIVIPSQAFGPTPFQAKRIAPFASFTAKAKFTTPEYIIEEDGDSQSEESLTPRVPRSSDEKTSEIRLSTPPENPVQENTSDTTSRTEPTRPTLQYAALPPGTVVQIQVGDMGLARKAWKKRRRSGSPLLVPCSVLNVDRASTVRWNLIYLLEKFGRAGAGSKGGITMSLANFAKRYRTHLKTSLAKQATALGFDDSKSLVRALFNERVQKSYGITMVENESGEISLQAPVSRLGAQKRAERSPVLQVEDDYHEDTLKHTGMVRTRRQDKVEGDDDNPYYLQPLSAALRVNQKEDVDPGNIQTGSMHTGVVFDYDVAGDAGTPMITLTLSSAPRGRLRFGSDGNQKDTIRRPKHMLSELKSGDGPLKGRVVRFVKGGALIDCEIGRRTGNRPDSDIVRVLGLLKFSDAVVEGSGSTNHLRRSEETSFAEDDTEDQHWKEILSFDDLDVNEEDLVEDDAEGEDDNDSADLTTLFNFDVEEDGEEVEDITHMFTTEVDGSITYSDPETGEVQHISMDSIEDDNDEHDDNDDTLDVFGSQETDSGDGAEDDEADGPVVLSKNTRTVSASTGVENIRSKRLHLGDEVDIYVRSVAKQSSQIIFTMRSSIKGKKAKDIKQESGREKKLSRLLKQIGGMGRIHQLHGREMEGIVKATSHTGDWLYVEPQEDSLPVGIAFGDEAFLKEVTKGDRVRIQLEGIDEARGQLSMKVLSKLAP